MPLWSACWLNDWRVLELLYDSPTSSGCPPRRKRLSRLQSWRTKLGTDVHPTFPRLPEPSAQRCWGRFRMRKGYVGLSTPLFFLFVALLFPLLSCSSKPDAST